MLKRCDVRMCLTTTAGSSLLNTPAGDNPPFEEGCGVADFSLANGNDSLGYRPSNEPSATVVGK